MFNNQFNQDCGCDNACQQAVTTYQQCNQVVQTCNVQEVPHYTCYHTHGNSKWDCSSPVIDGILRTAEGEVNLNLTATLRTLELQAATSFGNLICDDPLAVIAADSDFHGFRCRDNRCHIRQLLSFSSLLQPVGCVPAVQTAPFGRLGLSWILAGILPYYRSVHSCFVSISGSVPSASHQDQR